MISLFHRVIDLLTLLVFGYFVLLNAVYVITSLVAFFHLRRYARRLQILDVEDLISTAGAPPITLIAPAYNEEATCAEAMRSLLALNYPEFEILVVNDGSKDATVERLTQVFKMVPAHRLPTADTPTEEVRGILRSTLHPNLWLLDKENGGKSDALNAGINYSRTPLFCAMDADTLLERDALMRIVLPFLEDHRTVAAGGMVRIANGCSVRGGRVRRIGLPKSLIARFQVLEYLRAFLCGRVGWAALDATMIISGAFGLFRRSAVAEVGGYATDTVGEDMELIVRLHHHFRSQDQPYRVAFVPDPIAWTECPESYSVLSRQRERWQRGLAQVLQRHRKMMFRPRYGAVGMAAFPYFYFLEMLGPPIEVAGYIVFTAQVLLGWVSSTFVIAFLLVAFGLGIALSLAAVYLEELCFGYYTRFPDLLRLFALSVLENFGYRQLSSFWRLRGIVSALRGVKTWGKMTRRGFQSEGEP